ncbi:hypothetical protein [Algoriphagus sp. CAU 1675]|uniref:hypothetical protein n=1 Tax=Algoriphagus sp. CAU 1675 TaxID=3032597 RepID=UPI0023DBD828|nr:hypothetical protein [Algoriphagus sp. CAU 1675]MDF2158833.1 hypothetical protein [Algoriphagus sp. CAU 1675]
MKKRIEELLEKYWNGESSLEEEKELKSLLQNAEGFEEEKELFAGFEEYASLEPEQVRIPKGKIRKMRISWMSYAASAAILIGTFWGWGIFQQKQAEQEAYEEVMMAFALIQTNLSKGQDRLKPMNELKYLNTTEQLFKDQTKK